MQNNNIMIMMEFLEKAGIQTEGMTATYNEQINELTLKKIEYNGGLDSTKQTIKVKLDEQKNSVVIKNDVREEYNFQRIFEDEPEYRYNVDDTQILIKYKVNGEYLDVYSTTVTQAIKEDTMGGGSWITVNLNSFSDLLDENTIKWLPLGTKNYPIEKKSYIIPQGYKITDGVSQITDTINNTK